MSNLGQPPLPPSSRPPRLHPHHPAHSNGEPSSSSSRPKGHPSHSHVHRELPLPPISRTKESTSPLPPLPGSPKPREKEAFSPSSDRAVSPADRSRFQDTDHGPPLPTRSSAHGGRRQNRPPLPQRHVSSGSTSSSPGVVRGMPEGRTSPLSSSSSVGPPGPVLPPRTLRSPPNVTQRQPPASAPAARTLSDEIPRTTKPGRTAKPPPAGNRPKPTVPRKPALLSPTSTQSAKPFQKGVSRHEAAPPAGGIREQIRSLLREAPEIIKAVQDDYGTVPQLLEDLASLAESIVEGSKEEVRSSASFILCQTKLRDEVAALRDFINTSCNSPGVVTKVISNIVKQVQKISDLLQA